MGSWGSCCDMVHHDHLRPRYYLSHTHSQIMFANTLQDLHFNPLYAFILYGCFIVFIYCIPKTTTLIVHVSVKKVHARLCKASERLYWKSMFPKRKHCLCWTAYISACHIFIYALHTLSTYLTLHVNSVTCFQATVFFSQLYTHRKSLKEIIIITRVLTRPWTNPQGLMHSVIAGIIMLHRRSMSSHRER